MVIIEDMPLPEAAVVKALADAIRHANEVSNREHIKADRSERVGQFLVSLRRQLMNGCGGPAYPFLVEALTRKEVWFDVGKLNSPFVTRLPPTGVTFERVQKWLIQAEGMIPPPDELNALIVREMCQLEGAVVAAQVSNGRFVNLNADADSILRRMAELADEL